MSREPFIASWLCTTWRLIAPNELFYCVAAVKPRIIYWLTVNRARFCRTSVPLTAFATGKNMNRLLLLLGMLFSSLAFSQAFVAPDFTGIWKMTSRKASYPSSAPKYLIYTIAQKGNTVEISEDRDGRKNKFRINVTGERFIMGFPTAGTQRNAIAHWEPQRSLVVEVSDAVNENPAATTGNRTASYVERYTLSEDGKTLILVRRDVASKDQVTFDFEKQ